MKSDRPIRCEKGLDKWSGQHPVMRRRTGSWWKRFVRKCIRRSEKPTEEE